MTLKKYLLYISFFIFSSQFTFSQEGLPIYSDYLTDNYYLLHPSMAGVANCNKFRLTSRKQWLDQSQSPNLQTLSVNGRIGDSKSGVGAIVFNDKNGYHSQTGAYFTYAHHLLFSRNRLDLNMLSFGISAGMMQYKLDESSFLFDGFDPLVSGITQSSTDFNLDFGFSYHFLDFYAHATFKNFLKNDGINSNELGIYTYDNSRTYLLSTGNVFGRRGSSWSYEPSILFAYKESSKESFIDLNFKLYRETDFGKVWAGLSYRRSFEGAEYLGVNDQIKNQQLQYITPLVGVDFENFVFAYTYSYQSNSIVFDNGGYHQITLGLNFGCKKQQYDCNCPGIN
ncbi:type IX secretion system membrane protein PorP/SprF [Flavobacteriaceae bacterium]|jgi:type IX secretion system PorP/SprF family membrane protein|nr:type IX secretion system membrane protein PorP/SprF [Flavobacteriaceae bacterium]MDC1492817.1 type IX secretion system membrane protein PorP/SprF [Flavobacteriaceae bacterium]